MKGIVSFGRVFPVHVLQTISFKICTNNHTGVIELEDDNELSPCL